MALQIIGVIEPPAIELVFWLAKYLGPRDARGGAMGIDILVKVHVDLHLRMRDPNVGALDHQTGFEAESRLKPLQGGARVPIAKIPPSRRVEDVPCGRLLKN